MNRNPLQQLHAFGQSVWLDYISRELILSGKLKKMIKEDGLRGMTSNPSIFEKAIAESNDYDSEIRKYAIAGKGVEDIYELLTQKDVRDAADIFRPLYDESHGTDGFVSLEVNPHLAHNTDGTIKEAQRLWAQVDRPNIMIKVPATLEGLPAIEQLISEGLNVNVTLLFGVPRYVAVTQAYISGLSALHETGNSVKSPSSVASFFLSRIDVLIDPMLEKISSHGGEKGTIADSLHGSVAIESAKSAYNFYREIFGSTDFGDLRSSGAQSQRLLWASTSTKNPAYSDVKYIEDVIGPETVNTVPPETMDAFQDHGKLASTLSVGIANADAILQKLHAIGIDLNAATEQLEREGVEKFSNAFDALMSALKDKCVSMTDGSSAPIGNPVH
ncbi:MAG: transaldolase [Candidatus Kapaibacterium sp.]|jgi:transaldolase